MIDRDITALRSRGHLPARVRDLVSGVDLTWSESAQAYLVRPGAPLVVWAVAVRRHWGRFFGPTPHEEHQQELIYG